MTIPEKYKVNTIPREQSIEWLLYKHYAHRVPSITNSFGLFDNENILQGVLTIGMPCVQMNSGKCIFNDLEIKTLELTRLIVNDGLEKNVLSYFVSQVIKLLPQPLCLVSFADPNNGHHGYIYQATNWLYTGDSTEGGKNKKFIFNGRNFHGKTVTKQWCLDNKFNYDNNKTLYENFELNGGKIEEFAKFKHRYILLLGNKKQKREMLNKLKYQLLPYPKGNNTRYDTSYVPSVNKTLF